MHQRLLRKPGLRLRRHNLWSANRRDVHRRQRVLRRVRRHEPTVLRRRRVYRVSAVVPGSHLSALRRARRLLLRVGRWGVPGPEFDLQPVEPLRELRRRRPTVLPGGDLRCRVRLRRRHLHLRGVRALELSEGALEARPKPTPMFLPLELVAAAITTPSS